MGGTTAKICLIENSQPKTARTFEVARATRFAKGSGVPISIPVIEMIEVGPCGGSIAWVDSLGRIETGLKSAASEPGPACYQRGLRPAITDADLVLGKPDPDNFAGGAIKFSADKARAAIARDVGERLKLGAEPAAFGICEVVDENVANAARVHAVETVKFPAPLVRIASSGKTSRICALASPMSTGKGCGGSSKLASPSARALARHAAQPPLTGRSAAARAFGPA